MRFPTAHAQRLLTLLALVALSSVGLPAFAGGGPENVIVVVNADSWASRAIANEYVALRNIPPGNVVLLEDVPNFETITVDEFRAHLLQPVLDAINQRMLGNQIDIIAWSSDFPYAVDVRSDLQGAQPPQGVTPTASLTGLTYLYQPVLVKTPGYLRLDANAYYRRADVPRDDREWSDEEQRNVQRAAELLQQRENLEEAEAILARATSQHPLSFVAWYNYACALALRENPSEAIAALRAAVEAGWTDAAHTRQDADLSSLRQHPEFEALLADMQAPRTFGTAPTMGFRHDYAFDRAGNIVGAEAGIHYVLSTMLAVTAGRGLSIDEALAQLRRSAAADGSRPDGTFYYMTNGDVRSRTRAWAFVSAVKALGDLGHKAEVIEGDLPKNRTDILGLMAGIASFDFAASGSTILPGAICEHLTSFGGIMKQYGGQTPLTEFLRAGASGASGTVFEPYSIQAKFPDPFVHVHYARGASLAEAFYQSVAGPYQLLVVGDPLCAPWAQPPMLAIKGAVADERVRGAIDLEPIFISGGPLKQVDFFIDGKLVGRFTTATKAHIDTTMISDGWHELRFVAVAANAVETQGRVILPLFVDNQRRSAELSCERAQAGLHEVITMKADAPGAERIELHHLGRIIATIEGDSGVVEIDAAELGLGPSLVQAHAVYPEEGEGDAAGDAPQEERSPVLPAKHIVKSPPLEITITAPPLLPAARGITPAQLEDGLRIETPDGRAIAGDAREADWLSKVGARPDQPVTITGIFRGQEDALHQMQIRSPRRLTLAIDGQPIPLRETNEWQYVSLPLAQGLHEIEITLEGAGPPELDVRFGLAGSRSLDPGRFKHLKRER